jgi:hypothetical protein
LLNYSISNTDSICKIHIYINMMKILVFWKQYYHYGLFQQITNVVYFLIILCEMWMFLFFFNFFWHLDKSLVKMFNLKLHTSRLEKLASLHTIIKYNKIHRWVITHLINFLCKLARELFEPARVEL